MTTEKGAPPRRLASVDVFRGAVIGLMVLVNYVGGMPGAPAWSQHVRGRVDGYSLTDLVFPWFLFLAGVSIPLSLGKLLGAGNARAAAGRILPRVAGLVLLGVLLENVERTDPVATHMSESLWLASLLVAAVIIWKVRTRVARLRRIETVAKIVAGVVLVGLVAIWRGTSEEGESRFLIPGWWGILGLIGWSYLVAAVAYLVVRGSDRALLGLAVLAVCARAGGRLGDMMVMSEIIGLVPIVVVGAMAGIWLSSPSQEVGRVRRLLLLGLGLCAAGWLLRPLHGYHKNDATESWALLAAGYGALLLAAAHVGLDGRELPFFARWLALVGRNALLAYLLPELFDAIAGLFGVRLMVVYARGGWPGMANAAALTLAVMTVAAVATRRGFAMKL